MRAAVCLAAALAAYTAGVYLLAANDKPWAVLLTCLVFMGGLGFVVAAWNEARHE